MTDTPQAAYWESSLTKLLSSVSKGHQMVQGILMYLSIGFIAYSGV
jgi:hypothetical protein|nr:MAG: hypothetical protein [Bacteriophage sp.]